MVRFIHTSDWQLGMTRHYLDADAQARFTGDRIRTVRSILELARRRECAFVVVAGDVFEHPNLGRQDIGRALEAMGSQDIPVYLLPGNHDPLGTGSLWSSPAVADRLPTIVTVLDRTGIWPVSDGVELVAAPWHSKRPDADPVAGCLDGLRPHDTVRIVVGHGMLEELEPDKTSPVRIRRQPLDAALADGTIHYVALGDRHIRWPQDSPGAIQYSGTHESTSFRETGRGQVLEVDLDPGTTPSVTAHEVGQWQHVVVRRELNGVQDLDSLARDLDAMDPKENTIVRTAFTGSLTVSEHARLDQLLDDRTPLFASLQPWLRHTHLAVVPDDDELAQIQWGGYIQAALEELKTRAEVSGHEAHTNTTRDSDPDLWADEVPAEDDLPPEPTPPEGHQSAQDALRLLIRFAGGVKS